MRIRRSRTRYERRSGFSGQLDVLLLPPDRISNDAAIVAEIRQLYIPNGERMRQSRIGHYPSVRRLQQERVLVPGNLQNEPAMKYLNFKYGEREICRREHI